MDNDIKKLICEIILMIIIVIITIPICVNASNNYTNKKENMQKYNNISIDIENKNQYKTIKLKNYNTEKKVFNLILKTSKFSNEYKITLDGIEYNLKDIVYSEDQENYYFNLGSYEIKNNKNINFSMELAGDYIYDDSISYSFIAEVI